MKIDGKTKLAGVMGYPIEHTLSPVIHNAAFKALNMNGCYVPLLVHPDQLQKAVQGCRSMNYMGFNVTIPHKQAVMNFLDDVSEEAQLIGAVNTVVCKGDKLYGYNTDGIGFVKSLQNSGGEIKWDKQKMVLLGSGGAARAVAVQSALTGIHDVTIITREVDQGEEIAFTIKETKSHTKITIYSWEDHFLKKALCDATLLVNATPVGMAPRIDESPLKNHDWIHEGMMVYDLIYNPQKTRLLQEAEQRGAIIQNGLEMLIFQGAAAFEKWTDVFPSVDVMRKAVNEVLNDQ